MRFLKLAFIGLLAVAPVRGLARPWKGVVPGQTTQAEVIERFGEPGNRSQREGRLILVYAGDQAPDGTKKAQFHVDARGIVQEVTVFVADRLDADTVEGTYGKAPQKAFVEDTFQKVWYYPQAGVTVYFGKDGAVTAFIYTAGARGGTKAAAAEAAPGSRAMGPAAAR